MVAMIRDRNAGPYKDRDDMIQRQQAAVVEATKKCVVFHKDSESEIALCPRHLRALVRELKDWERRTRTTGDSG
jgi:hypothetical protein